MPVAIPTAAVLSPRVTLSPTADVFARHDSSSSPFLPLLFSSLPFHSSFLVSPPVFKQFLSALSLPLQLLRLCPFFWSVSPLSSLSPAPPSPPLSAFSCPRRSLRLTQYGGQQPPANVAGVGAAAGHAQRVAEGGDGLCLHTPPHSSLTARASREPGNGSRCLTARHFPLAIDKMRSQTPHAFQHVVERADGEADAKAAWPLVSGPAMTHSCRRARKAGEV